MVDEVTVDRFYNGFYIYKQFRDCLVMCSPANLAMCYLLIDASGHLDKWLVHKLVWLYETKDWLASCYICE